MNCWYMLTLVGEDRSGIVAEVTQTLFRLGYELGEASMMRLGGNFAVMLMIHHPENKDGKDAAQEVAEKNQLHVHLDEMKGGLHQHVEPNIQVTVSGADRPGIVAEVTGLLTEQGVNIVDLESDVAGTTQRPLYIMYLQGVSQGEISGIQQSLASLNQEGIEITVSEIDVLVG